MMCLSNLNKTAISIETFNNILTSSRAFTKDDNKLIVEKSNTSLVFPLALKHYLLYLLVFLSANALDFQNHSNSDQNAIAVLCCKYFKNH